MFQVAGQDVSLATLTIPAVRFWHLRAAFASGKAPAEGAMVTATFGDLTATGTVTASYVDADVGTCQIVGGYGGWSKVVRARPYHSLSGVTLAEVASDLATDAGERLEILEGGDAALGYSWSRMANVASHELDALAVRWWLGLDSVTRIGSRPTVQRSGLKLSVVDYDHAHRLATLQEADDKLASLVPGSRISAEGMPVGTVRATVIRVSGTDAVVDVEFAR
ncbi:hypothetical protein BE21_57495 [Sorangium cellulosum]|uniref:Uncharacterized protein n=1 Tax=Sorangium cellulosum TaxID=56 RepID=A0A150U3I8_SORCE|nr:hypothetical protein BE21_57495 [Sorangium cellulosum]